MGMQQLVRFLAARFLQKILINLFDKRIMMRASCGRFFIIVVDPCNSCFTYLIGGVVRLSPTGNTTASAGHNLEKMTRGFLPGFLRSSHLLQQIANVRNSVSDCYPDLLAFDINGGGAYTLHTAYGFEGNPLVLVSGNQVVCGSKRCFHNPAGGPEDGSRSGIRTDW